MSMQKCLWQKNSSISDKNISFFSLSLCVAKLWHAYRVNKAHLAVARGWQRWNIFLGGEIFGGFLFLKMDLVTFFSSLPAFSDRYSSHRALKCEMSHIFCVATSTWFYDSVCLKLKTWLFWQGLAIQTCEWREEHPCKKRPDFNCQRNIQLWAVRMRLEFPCGKMCLPQLKSS